MSNIPDTCKSVNLENFYRVGEYDRWPRCEPLALPYTRTSSRVIEAKYSHAAQLSDVIDAIYRRTGTVPGYWVDEIGVNGHRINPKDRTGLHNLKALALAYHVPIVAWDWTRLARTPELLIELDQWGVDFVCLQPFDLSHSDLHSLRMKSAIAERERQNNPESQEQQLVTILNRRFIHTDLLN